MKVVLILILFITLNIGNTLKKSRIVSCSSGDVNACKELGKMYFSGRWVKKNHIESENFFKKAIDIYKANCLKKDKNSCQNLGSMYRWAMLGKYYDKDLGTKYLTQACELGDGESCYWVGIYSKKDVNASLKFYLKGCEYENSSACSSLASLYLNGDGAKRDVRKSKELSKKSKKIIIKVCENGDSKICRGLSQKLAMASRKTPHEIEKKALLDKSIYFYTLSIEHDKKSCEDGDIKSCMNITHEIRFNKSKFKQYNLLSEKYYLKACEGGNARACGELGTIYLWGVNVAKSQSKTDPFRSAFGQVKLKKSDAGVINKNIKKGIKFYEKGCDEFDDISCSKLGNIYKYGKAGVKKNEQKALVFYKRACSGGNQVACHHVAAMTKKDQVISLCDAEIKKKLPDMKIVHKECLREGENKYKEDDYETASWYYLLAGENNKSIQLLTDKIYKNPSNLGHSYALEGNFTQAKKLYSRFKQHFEPFANKMIQPDFPILSKLYPQKKDNIQKALSLWNIINTGLKNMDWVYRHYEEALEKQQYDKAINALSKVIGFQKEFPNIRVQVKDLTDNLNSLAILYFKSGKYNEAIELLHQVETEYSKPNSWHDSSRYIDLYKYMATSYAKIMKYDKSILYFNKLIEIYSDNYGEEHVVLSNLYSQVGKIYYLKQDYLQAYSYLQKALNIFIVNRDKFFRTLTSKDKENYIINNKKYIEEFFRTAYVYQKTIKNYHKSQTVIQDVFTSWINYKGSIFNSENVIKALLLYTKDKTLKSKIEKLMDRKRKLANLYQSLPKPKEKKKWEKSISETKYEIKNLNSEIASKSVNFKESQGLKSIHTTDISTHLKDNEFYVDYAKAGENYYVFSLDHKDHVTFTRIDLNSSKRIDKLILSFRNDVNSILNDKNMSVVQLKQLTYSSKQKLSKLYEIVLSKPLAKVLKSKKSLIISPDGALRLMPFEAMFNKKQGKYLIEEKEVRYIPSGKELVRLYKYSKTKQTNNNTVIFANPDFNAKIGKLALSQQEAAVTPNTSRAGIIKSLFKMRFNPLPGTKEEAISIKETLAGTTKLQEYLELEASEANLMNVKEPNILHIATHGFFINDNTIPNPMLKSGIALSGANTSAIKGKSDGIVTSLKLSGLNLKGTDLVVLSACETGVVDVNSTESVSGLSKAFIQAGAKDTVISLWSVDDQATKELMSSFYKEMQVQPNYTKAMQEAKLKMIQKNMHPFFWAPFIVNGL